MRRDTDQKRRETAQTTKDDDTSANDIDRTETQGPRQKSTAKTPTGKDGSHAIDHKIIMAIGWCAILAGCIITIWASDTSYVDKAGYLHENFTAIVGSKVLVIAGAIVSIIAYAKARREASDSDDKD